MPEPGLWFTCFPLYDDANLVNGAERIWEDLTRGKIPETNLLTWLDTDEMLLDGGPRKLHEGGPEEYLIPSCAQRGKTSIHKIPPAPL